MTIGFHPNFYRLSDDARGFSLFCSDGELRGNLDQRPTRAGVNFSLNVKCHLSRLNPFISLTFGKTVGMVLISPIVTDYDVIGQLP